ncbi:MAG TPA: type II toxin-antitoxin system VapC family toxin [Longimicrobiales bacterium]|nr:type II toxin-antitoxin system VapC family toxin [Longimicrobiales bacterium]
MIIVDLNALLYAVNADGPHHEAAKPWLEDLLSGDEVVALPWVVLLGFLRLSTNPRIFPSPLDPEQALEVVDGWLSHASVRPLSPGGEHWRILRSLLLEAGTAGDLTTDAHLAALAIAHGAELHSTDTDFARFPYLRWVNLLERWSR